MVGVGFQIHGGRHRVGPYHQTMGKELFTSADNYMLQTSDSVPTDSLIRQLIFAAVMCIDMVLKE